MSAPEDQVIVNVNETDVGRDGLNPLNGFGQEKLHTDSLPYPIVASDHLNNAVLPYGAKDILTSSGDRIILTC